MDPDKSGSKLSSDRRPSRSSGRLYRPSWIDVFNQWVYRLPVNLWVFHVFLGIALILIHLLFLWLEDSLLTGEIFPIIIFNSLAIPYLLVLIFLLDQQALNALNGFRPVLKISQEEFDSYAYKISNMPFLAPLVAGILVVLSTILLPSVTISPARYAVLEQLPVFNIVYQILDKSSAFLFGVFVYHTIHQLRLVNLINKRAVNINLFDLTPLQAFSRLTGATAIGLLVFVYPWMLINPELLRDPILFAIVSLYTLIAIIVFVWPLWGVHRIIEQEKQKALRETDRRFEMLIDQFNQHIDGGDYAASEMLHGSIASLDIQHKRISAVATWPWKSETARIVLTAIALPILLMFLQYFILQALNS
jgi:hypothetical protein